MKFDQRLLDKVQTLPHHPGVYQYLDQIGQIIYVGKAIDLKKRVSSYFQKEHLDGKTRTLVKLIADIRFTVVQNELEALLLENNLIKSYRPRYNVLLKDDKTYPWIVIKNETFPRIFDLLWSVSKCQTNASATWTRARIISNKNLCFGPSHPKTRTKKVQGMLGIPHWKMRWTLRRFTDRNSI
jgi:hypothetical protein